MTDRSVQVTIGAVLASNFRSSFREARTEVTGLSRALDILGGRRSNAGLTSIREATDRTRTSMRGLRTEATATARGLETFATRASRAAPAIASLGAASRTAARDVSGLGAAFRGLDTGRGAGGFNSMASAAMRATTGLRGVRTEGTQVNRTLQTMESRATRAATSLGNFAREARAASSATGGLNRSTQATAGHLGAQAAALSSTTSAIRQMTAATNAQIGAANRLNRTPITGGAVGGGGRGGGAGGHGGGRGGIGGHMPAVAHGALHAGIGTASAGLASGYAIHEVWKNASERAHEITMRRVQGWSGDQTKQLTKQSEELSTLLRNVSENEIIKSAGHLGTAFGSKEDVLHHLAPLQQATSLLKLAVPNMDADANSYGMVKGLEQLMQGSGTKRDAGWFDKMVERLTAATIASGGKFNGSEFFSMVGKSGGAMQHMKDDAIIRSYAVAQEMGGSTAGNTMSMVRSALVGGRMTRGAASTLDSIGLLDRSKSDPTMTQGGSPSIRGAGRHTGRIGGSRDTQVGRASVVDTKMLEEDLFKWTDTYLAKALKDYNITDGGELGKFMSQAFSNKSAERLMSIALLQKSRIDKDYALQQVAEANLANYGVNSSDIKEGMTKEQITDLIRSDPRFAMQSLHSQWENFTSKGVFQELMKPVSDGLNLIADGLNRLSRADPKTAMKFVTLGAAIIGLPAIAWAASAAFTALGAGWTRLGALAMNPWFLGVAAAGYLIYKNWDWVSGFAQGAAPGFTRALDNMGSAFASLITGAENVLKVFGQIPASTESTADAFNRGATAGERFGAVLPAIVEGLAILAGASVFARVVASLATVTSAITGVNAAAGTGFFARLFAMGGISIVAGAAAVVGTAAIANHVNGLDTPEADKERDRVSKLGWGSWIGNMLDPNLEGAGRWVGSKMGLGDPEGAVPRGATTVTPPGSTTTVVPPGAGGTTTVAPAAPTTVQPGANSPTIPASPSSAPGGGRFDGLLHRSSFEGGATAAGARSQAENAFERAIRDGTRDGVLEAFRMFSEGRGSASSSVTGAGGGTGVGSMIHNASYGGGGALSGGIGGAGIGGGGAGGIGGGGGSSIGSGGGGTGVGAGGGGGGNPLAGGSTGIGSGPGTAVKGTLAKNQQEAYKAARAEGLSDKAARALVANMSGESLKNPGDHHWDRSHMSQGIVQWDPQRAEAIKRQFGKYPKDMSVAEQTKASIWEINNNPAYRETKRALAGDNEGAMIGSLVKNYERPQNSAKAIAERSGFYRGFKPGGSDTASIDGTAGSTAIGNAATTGTGLQGVPVKSDEATGGGDHAAALSNLARDLTQNGVPGGMNRFTAFNDRFHHHANPRSKHTHGLASDFTIKDPRQSAAAAEAVRERMRSYGLGEKDFKVIDEYKALSGHGTGGHIHTQFNSPQAAARAAAAQAAQATAAATAKAASSREAINGAARAQGQRPSPGAGGETTIHAPITINPHPHQSPDDIGRSAAEHMTSARNEAAGLRSATFDWTA